VHGPCCLIWKCKRSLSAALRLADNVRLLFKATKHTVVMLNAYVSCHTGILHDPFWGHHNWFAAGKGSALPSIRILKTVAASSLCQTRLQQMMEVSRLPQTTQLSSRLIQSCRTTLWESMMMLTMTCMSSGGTNTPEVSSLCNIPDSGGDQAAFVFRLSFDLSPLCCE